MRFALRLVPLALVAIVASGCATLPSSDTSYAARSWPRQTPVNTMTDTPAPRLASPFASGKPLAYVMMVQWISPLVSRDYSAHWNLLFTQGLAERNKDDDYHDPAGTLIRYLGGKGSDTPLGSMFLFEQLLLPARGELVDDQRWFYTVMPDRKQPRWYTQHVTFAAPQRLIGTPLDPQFWEELIPDAFPNNPKDVDPRFRTWFEQAQAKSGNKLTSELLGLWITEEIYGAGEGHNKKFNPTNARPTINVDTGDRAVAFYSLARALRYLEANPQQPVWLMTFDAPDIPGKWKQASENALWMVLVHPSYNTHPFPRKPLASIYAPQRVSLAEVKNERFAAHRDAIGRALAAANTNAADAGRFFHDAGYEGAVFREAIGPMLHGLGELQPGDGVAQRLYDVDRYLKNAGAAAAAMNFAFATAFVNETGTPALVVATREKDAVYAVAFGPPPEHVPPGPRASWRRARSERFAYFPWWGPLVDPMKMAP